MSEDHNRMVDHKVLFMVDGGMNVAFAEAMAASGYYDRVLYFCPWVSAFADPNLAYIGTGIKGVERVLYFWESKHEFDSDKESVVFFFADVNFADWQWELKRQGYAVWGSMSADDLELYRWDAKQMMKKVGLSSAKSMLITGIPDLRDYLEKHDNVFVKVSQFRGITETFESASYELVKNRIDRLESELGPLAEDQEFIVEHAIETKIETGGDEYSIDGKYPKDAAFGFEIKDTLYVVTALERKKLPEAVRHVHEALAPIFKQYEMRGFFSSEIRRGTDGKDYPIDLTLRNALPPSDIMSVWMTNMPEIIWKGAHGEMVDFVVDYKYAFEFVLYSEEAAENPLAVKYPKEITKFVRLYNKYQDKHGMAWVLPTAAKLVQIGAVLGFGDTIQSAHDHALKNAEQIHADKLEIRTDAVGKLWEELREAKKKGIYFGDSPLPNQA
jgi:hypothetical protein